MHWFVQFYLEYGSVSPGSSTAKTASFIMDLLLLDHSLLAYAPSLRAQCALVLAAFLSPSHMQGLPGSITDNERGGSEGERPQHTPTATPTSTSTATTSPLCDSPRSAYGSEACAPLAGLDHWYRYVREAVCRGN